MATNMMLFDDLGRMIDTEVDRDREERARTRSDRDDLVARAYQNLYDEFVEAIHANPSTTIQTPAYGSLQPYSVADVIADDMSGESEPLHDLLQMMVDAANGADIQLRSSVWIDARAKEHAKFHCDDLATEMEEGGA